MTLLKWHSGGAVTATDIRHDAFRTVSGTAAAGATTSPSRLARWFILAFILGMVIPIRIQIGPLQLMPHRVVLLVLFLPLFAMLFSGKAGRIRFFDIFMLLSAVWAALALAVKGTVLGASIIEQMGVHVLEAFGSYMLARVTIRSAADFMYFVKVFFFALLVLAPFGVLEAITHRPIMLELIPQSVAINTQSPRWGLRRAQTVFAHPILFGAFCSAGFALCWYAMRTKATRLGGTFLAFAGTFASMSAGALLSIVVQSIFLGWDKTSKPLRWRWMIFFAFAVAGYVTIDLLSNRTPIHVLVSYATFNSGNAYTRILIWQFGMENVWANPMFGLGADITLWERPTWMAASVDNYWLLLTMQFGIPCFLFLVTAIFLIVRRVALAPLADAKMQACRAGYLIVLGGLIIAGGTVHYWHGVMAFLMFFFGAGVWAIDAGSQLQDTPEGTDTDALPQEAATDRGLVYTREHQRHSRDRPVSAPVLHRRTAVRRGDG